MGLGKKFEHVFRAFRQNNMTLGEVQESSMIRVKFWYKKGGASTEVNGYEGPLKVVLLGIS
jgi:hypothetical protein